MDDSIFWLRIWTAVIGSLLTVLLALVLNSAFESKLIAEAVKGGADPIKARCAIAGFSASSGGLAICSAAR